VAKKMYIFLLDELTPGQAVVAAAHASLGCYFKFKDHPDTVDWISGPFYKTICKVSQEEFKSLNDAVGWYNTPGCPFMFADAVVLTESSLNNKEVSISFRPREADKFPKAFKFYKLWR
jgi:hypothetical protein